MIKYYKVLGKSGECCHGGVGKWKLPDGDSPGEWMPRIEHIEPGHSGYHVMTREQLRRRLGPTVWRVEVRGAVWVLKNECVVHEARLLSKVEAWDENTRRLFADDCAEHVLYLLKWAHPNDDRPRRAIEVMRAYRRGEVGKGMRDAAWCAAWEVLGGEGDAAWDAEERWQTDRLWQYLEGRVP